MKSIIEYNQIVLLLSQCKLVGGLLINAQFFKKPANPKDFNKCRMLISFNTRASNKSLLRTQNNPHEKYNG